MTALRSILFIAIALGVSACAGTDRVVVAAGTTLVDSGILDHLAEGYESERPGPEVSIVGRATQEVLELGHRGAADLLITHAPSLEAEFLETHDEASAQSLFSSRFLLVGPPDRAEQLDGLGIIEALQVIAARGWSFLSRGDGSGTHIREVDLWAAANVTAEGRHWFSETGQGMGLSMQVADQSGAFILAEEGTFLIASPRLGLRTVLLEESADLLVNPYAAIQVKDHSGAGEFLSWLVSGTGRRELDAANRLFFGKTVFSPSTAG